MKGLAISVIGLGASMGNTEARLLGQSRVRSRGLIFQKHPACGTPLEKLLNAQNCDDSSSKDDSGRNNKRGFAKDDKDSNSKNGESESRSKKATGRLKGSKSDKIDSARKPERSASAASKPQSVSSSKSSSKQDSEPKSKSKSKKQK